jgi:hypothetical protein
MLSLVEHDNQSARILVGFSGLILCVSEPSTLMAIISRWRNAEQDVERAIRNGQWLQRLFHSDSNHPVLEDVWFDTDKRTAHLTRVILDGPEM